MTDAATILASVTVEISSIPADTFILGLSLLGVTPLGGSGAVVWREILGHAQSLRTSSGGEIDGVTTTLDVGSLNVELVNYGNPLNDPGIEPNTPIRLVEKQYAGTASPPAIWTGKIEDVFTSYDKAGNYRVSVFAVDAVRDLVNTRVVGAGVDYSIGYPTPLMSWLARMTELTLKTPVVSTRIGAVETEVLDPIGTGWTVFGTIPTGQAYGIALDQPGDLLNSSDSGAQPFSAPVYFASLQYGIQRTITGLTIGREYVFYVSAKNSETEQDRCSALAGTNVERVQDFVLGVYSPAANGYIWGKTKHLPSYLNKNWTESFSIAFVAEGTTATIRWARDFTGDIVAKNDYGFASSRWFPDHYWIGGGGLLSTYDVGNVSSPSSILSAVAYDSSLKSHLDLVSNSSGSLWWVTAKNELNYARHISVAGGDKAYFTDGQLTGHEGSVGYYKMQTTEAELSYDTRNVANVLTLKNHGAQTKDDSIEYVTDDFDKTFTDPTSVSLWRERAASLDVSLSEAFLPARADAIFASSSTPVNMVRTVRVNAGDMARFTDTLYTNAHPVLIPLFALYSSCRVKFANSDDPYLIVGIKHSFATDRWFVDYTLRRI